MNLKKEREEAFQNKLYREAAIQEKSAKNLQNHSRNAIKLKIK